MGKNINGGNKNKKFARKQISNNNSNNLRFSTDEYERYAIVVKMSGGAICRIKVIGIENELICHIRGKYRGRNKTSNLISPGSIILVGLRPDMSNNDECDLLYVYDSNEVEQLLTFPNLNISLLLNIDENNNNKISKVNDGFIFSNDEISNITFSDDNNDLLVVDNNIISIEDI